MRLKYIESVSFHNSEATHYKNHKWSLGAGDVACLVSKSGNQMLFIYKETAGVLRSERLRLMTGQVWNPLLLVDYAKQVGLEIEGLRTFAQHYERLKKGKW